MPRLQTVRVRIYRLPPAPRCITRYSLPFLARVFRRMTALLP